MANPRLTDEQLKEAVDAYVKFGCVARQAANYLNLPEKTYLHRLYTARQKGYEVNHEKVGPQTDSSLELSVAKDKIKQLETQIKTSHKETLDEEFVKRKIFKLAEQSVEPPEWLVQPSSNKGSAGVPTLLASDWHWGEVVDPRQVNGINEYNITIAQNRARTMIEVTIDLLKNHIAHKNYPGIVFALGGDMVSGDIHEELSATNEKEIMPTVIDLWGTLVWCIQTLADEFGNVFVPCVTGNHGRNTHKIRNKGRNYTSFDWLCYQFLAKHFEKDRRVRFLIPDGSDAHWQIYNHRYVLSHGDQFRGGDSLIGSLGPVIRGDHKKRGRNSQIGLDYDTLLLGHFHQLIQLQRLIVNGSLKGYCEFAYANNFPFEPPRQALWLTNPQHGITFSAPIYVDRTKKMQKNPEWIVWKE